ncbi:DnaJ [Trichinella spiralis]|uniref:DnaJ n=1 Tax=Trichinella spiralis TaxID=6334 RepID=A0ABR3KBZ6_TRISP
MFYVLKRQRLLINSVFKILSGQLSTNNENFYDILGVSRHASLKQIKRAFVDLSKKYHPDVNKGDRTCSSRYVKIVEAYSILSKPESRRKYDAELHAQNYSHENRERPSNKNYQSSYSYGWNSWNPNQSPFYYYVRQSTSQTKADDDAADVNVHIIRVVFFVLLPVLFCSLFSIIYRGLDILEYGSCRSVRC